MSQKPKKPISNKELLNLILELNHRLINIGNKIDEILPKDDIFVELEGEAPILIPEDVYLEMCNEMGEDFMKFMGVS